MVQLPYSRDIQQVGLANRMRTTQAREVGAEGASLQRVGEATNEIANRVREQQIDNDLLAADMRASKLIDQRMAELRTRDDWENFEAEAEKIARESMDAARPKFSGLRGRNAWTAATGRRVEQQRQRGQTLGLQRGTELAVASVEAMRAQARMVIQDDTATPEQIAEATTKALTAAAGARARGFMGADDVERMRGDLEGAAAERSRRIAREARIVSAVDSATAAGPGLAERMAWVAANVPVQDRDDVEDRVTQTWQRERTAREDQIDAAMGDAYAAIEGGRGFDSLPQETRDLITRAGKRDDLRNYARNRAGGADGSGYTAMKRQSEFMRDYYLALAAEPSQAQEFARMDIMSIPGLMPDDLAKLRQRQRYLRGEGSMTDAGQTLIEEAYGRVKPVAERAAAVAGLNVNYDGESTRDKAETARRQTAQFRSYIYAEVRDFVTTQNRAPDQREIEAIAAGALRKSRGRRGMFGEVERFRFEASPEGAVRVPFANIPEYQKERLVRLWRRSGRTTAPSEADIEAMYQTELANRAAPQ